MTSAVELASQQFFNNEPLHLELLDNVVNLLNTGSGDEQKQANLVLMKLREDPSAWSKVDAVLMGNCSLQSKYFALQILEQTIQTRWKALPMPEREGIKKFLVELIINLSSNIDSSVSNLETTFLHKLNLVLVHVVKEEWPRNWPTFISDIIKSSEQNQNICVNNMNILSLLSEDVFDFGSQNLTQTREFHLKKEFCEQFGDVFRLCVEILEKCPSTSMVRATLKTLHRFLSWIPVGYIFESNIIALLCNNFLMLEIYRVTTLRCLTEIASVDIQQVENANTTMNELFFKVMEIISNLLNDTNPDLAAGYQNGTEKDQEFISSLVIFLSTFLKDHIQIVEVPNNCSDRERQLLFHYAMTVMVAASKIEEMELFKICIDFWSFLTAELYRDNPFDPEAGSTTAKVSIYRTHLSDVRRIVIGRMAKPEEVLVVENENGEVIREMVKDTDSITLYKNMRETLVYLTHLNKVDTEQIMVSEMAIQASGSPCFSRKTMNSLCWAIGSISGVMSEEHEKAFLVGIIRELLQIVEKQRGKDNKAVVASNIMYIVGQYPRFLRAHWTFLKTVVKKLFEFMHEAHEGVQDMACDTFIKIAIKTKRHFIMTQREEKRPFVEEIIQNLSSIICDLTPAQSHVFFEALGCLISGETNAENKKKLIMSCMEHPNYKWESIINIVQENVNHLADLTVLKDILNVLKVNVAICKAVGDAYINQLGTIFTDLLSLYRILSSELSEAIAKNGDGVLKDPLFKAVKSIKREFTVLLSTWISKTGDAEDEKNIVTADIIPPLFEVVLLDYKNNVPGAREPTVLSLISIITVQQGKFIRPQVENILASVFECTLEMINQDMEAWPEHRTNFFKMLHTLIEVAWPIFNNMPDQQLKVVIDAVVWAFQHSMRNVAEIGLDILKNILEQVSQQNERDSQKFYDSFYMLILQHFLAVLADSNQVHVAGLTYYSDVLCALFRAPEYYIKVPLNPENTAQSNIDFIYCYVGDLFTKHFENLTSDQIRVIVKGFFSYNTDRMNMKNHIRDFLIQLKSFVGGDTADLYLEEREEAIQKAQDRKSAIPGLVNPNDFDDEEMM